jgi:hypothetical protein
MIPQNSHASSRPFRGKAIALLLRRWRGTRKSLPAKGCTLSRCPKRILSWAAWFWEFPLAVSAHSSRLNCGWLHVIRELSQTGSTRGKLVIGHSIQLGVFRLGFPEDWDVTIGIFPLAGVLFRRRRQFRGTVVDWPTRGLTKLLCFAKTLRIHKFNNLTEKLPMNHRLRFWLCFCLLATSWAR